MKVYYGLDNYRADQKIALTIGSFDGVHLAHQSILKQTKDLAKSIGAKSAVISFSPHPRITLNKEPEKLRLLSTIDEKILLLERNGIDFLFLLRFDQAFASQLPQDFISQLLYEKIGMRGMVIGYDHKFGKGRTGNFDLLQNLSRHLDFRLQKIEQQNLSDSAISSTRTRNALRSGEIEEANKLLGYNYLISGEVFRGDQLGRTIGYPTANIRISDTYKLIPADGIYAVRLLLDGTVYEGMGYIGHRPVLGIEERRVEVNIFNFKQDIYGKAVQVEWLARIRGDKNFDNMIALKAEIKKDEEKILAYFKSIRN